MRTSLRLRDLVGASYRVRGALWLALLAVVVPLVIVERLADQLVLPRLAATSAFVGGGLLWIAYSTARDKGQAWRLRAAVGLPLLAFVIANVGAAAFAVDRRASLLGESERYQGLLPTLLYVALFLASATLVRTRRDLSIVLGGLFVSGTAVAGYALIQRLGLDWIDWVQIPEGRVGSTFGQPDVLGAFLVVGLATTAGLFAGRASPWRWLLAAGAVVMMIALLLTSSRAAWIGAAAAAVILAASLIHSVRWTRFGVLCVLLGLILSGTLFASVAQGRSAASHSAERVASATDFTDTSVAMRLGLWRSALEMIADRPVLGAGQDAFPILFSKYRRADQPGIGTDNVRPESAHNIFLDLGTGTGLLGLGAFVWLLGAVLTVSWNSTSLCSDSRLRFGLVGSMAAIVGYVSALYFGFTEGMTTWVLWLLMGAAVGAASGVTLSNVQPATGWRHSFHWALGATALVGGCAALAWAATLVGGDLAAGQAQRAAAAGDLEDAVRLSQHASTLNPLERQYLLDRGQYEYDLAAASTDSTAWLERSEATYERVVRDYAPDAYSLLMLASVRGELANLQVESAEDVYPLLEEAVAVDPYNLTVRQEVAGEYAWLGNDAMSQFHLDVAQHLAGGN
ncbi:MAG: O-antigen ligase family protein [Dehalococcoidia bacterium]